jgi:hypothetical protein
VTWHTLILCAQGSNHQHILSPAAQVLKQGPQPGQGLQQLLPLLLLLRLLLLLLVVLLLVVLLLVLLVVRCVGRRVTQPAFDGPVKVLQGCQGQIDSSSNGVRAHKHVAT